MPISPPRPNTPLTHGPAPSNQNAGAGPAVMPKGYPGWIDQLYADTENGGWTATSPAEKADADPGDVFPNEPTVTASDIPNAAKLGPLGYVASPQTAWTTGQKITVNGFDFNWSGTAWAPGAHAAE